MVIFTIILVVGFFCIAIASGYVVIESNAKELYVTINGEEYHFKFKE